MSANNTAREKRVEKATLRVLFRVPFFAPAVARLPITFQDGIGTACTDGHGIKMDPAFVDTLSDDQLVTLICHEACHPMLGHLWRAPESAKLDQASWDTWNKATDHAVNLMLKDFSKLVMGRDKVADPFPFPDPPEAYCANPAFAGMAEETIFNILNSEKGGGGGSGNATGQSGGVSGQPSSGKAPGTKAGRQGNGKKGQGGSCSMPDFGQFEQPKAALDQSSQKKLRNDWEGTLINAVKMAQGRGDLPGGFERYVDELVSNQVPWTEILRSWLREQCADDWNWQEPALEYDQSGFIMPSLKSDKVGPIVFATDTSGSIDQGQLAKFQAEKQNCLDELKPKRILDIYADTKIHKVAEYAPGDTIALDAPGGGGTSFCDVFEYVDKLPERPKCIVYLTDLDGTFPVDPHVPCLWITWSKGKEAPFGTTVYVGD